MKDILWLVGNTLSVTFRKKKNIIMYLFMPLIGIFIALVAYGGDTKTNLHVGVVNHDQQVISQDTVKFLQGLKNVKVSKINESQIQDKITSGTLDTVITLDEGYSESVLKGAPQHIEITSIKGAAITGYVKSYLYQYIDNISTISQIADGNQQAFDKMYKDFQTSTFKVTTQVVTDTSKGKGMTYTTVGFLIMIMLMSAGNMSEIILTEKENRTYFRLLSTPISARKYILSNVIVNMIVMTIQVIITLTVLTTVFNIDIQIPLIEAALVLFTFALVAVGLALVIVSFSNSRSAANALQNLIVLPTVMLSGCFWPLEVMPDSLQKIANFLPQRWTLSTITALQEGNTLGSLYLNFMILLGFALAFFLIAIYKFGRNNNTKSFV